MPYFTETEDGIVFDPRGIGPGVPEAYRALFVRLRAWLNEQPEVLSAEISADSVIANLATHDLIISLEADPNQSEARLTLP